MDRMRTVGVSLLAVSILIGCAGVVVERSMAAEPASEVPITSPEADARLAPSVQATKSEEAQDEGPVAEPPRTLGTRAVYQVRPPQLLARVDAPDLSPLPLVAEDVTVVIAGHRIRVVLDMVFHNNTDEQLAGTLMMALPDRASPAYLGMYLGADQNPPSEDGLLASAPPDPDSLLGRTLELPETWETESQKTDWGPLRSAVVVEPVRGRQVYEAVTRRRVDPALAEWAGTGSYSARIFPLPPNSFKRVVFAYDQTVVPAEGRISLPLPNPDESIRERRLTVHDVGNSVASSTITLGRTVIEAERTNYGKLWRVAGEVGASGTPIYEGVLRNPAFSALVGSDPRVPGTLISMTVSPKLRPRAMVTPTGRALFVIDTSHSGRQALYNLSGQMLRMLLTTDDSITEFAIVVFDVRATLLTPGFVPNREEVRAHYLSQIENLLLGGATSLGAALDYLDGLQETDLAETIFLLSDGAITWGTEDPTDLLANHPKVATKRWICYSFGLVPHNRRLFSSLTRAGGQIVHVQPAQGLADAARAHRYPVSRFDGARSALQDEVVVAGDPRLLYPGQVLELAVRTTRHTAEIRLILRIDGADTEIRVPLVPVALTQDMGARAWGEVFVGGLLDDPSEAEGQAIAALSRHFSLSNAYASFLILETDEEYRQHRVSQGPLDFRQVRLTLSAQRQQPAVETVRLSGMTVPAEFPRERITLIRGLATLPPTAVWDTDKEREIVWNPRVVLERPNARTDTDRATDLYLAAQDLRIRVDKRGEETNGDVETKPTPDLDMAHALRTLSTIAELQPRDDRALRLVSFVLMEWSLYQDAARILSGVRERRPFEPQNLLLEAMVQAALGQVGDAALRLEVLLTQPFPRFEEYARPVAVRLYRDLLASVIRRHPNHPHKGLWERRLAELPPDELPIGRLLLFWNLDDTDVDLHVRERALSTVWYGRPESGSGGRLSWDNTDGLGPELYEHPRLSRSGFKVYVDYFGSSSVEGVAPAATLVAAFSRPRKGQTYRVEWYATVLTGITEENPLIMPRWKRPRSR